MAVNPIETVSHKPSEELRAVEDMSKPDCRQTHMAMIDHQGTTRPKTIDDQHAMAAQYALDAAVPEDVRIQWDTARNLWLYAWHVWRFYSVAEMQAYATLEMALRLKLGHDRAKKPPTLKSLMDEAVKKNLLRDEAVEYHRRLSEHRAEQLQEQEELTREYGWPVDAPNPTVDPQAYCKELAETFPKLRNYYAHGSSSVTGTNGLTFSLCRDLIDQLYPG